MSRIDLYPSKNSAPSEAQVQTCTVNGLKVGADVQVQGGDVTTDKKQLAKRIDFITDSLFYKGEALPGTATSLGTWRISKVTIAGDGDVTVLWANGSSQFANIWDNRLSLTYS